MRRERYTVNNGFETTAIDSGTIWTTENIPIDDYRNESNYFSANPSSRQDVSVNRGGFEAQSANYGIPRPSYEPERQRTEVSFSFLNYYNVSVKGV